MELEGLFVSAFGVTHELPRNDVSLLFMRMWPPP
jgi:hypothetical protein